MVTSPLVFAVLPQLSGSGRNYCGARSLVAHVTIWRWVQRYAQILNQRIHRGLRSANRSWRVDATYVRVAGSWAYLYRAVDSVGETIDFMLSSNRDLMAAKLFPRLALSGGHEIGPRVVNVDGHPVYARVIAELKQSGQLGRRGTGREPSGNRVVSARRRL
jgi:transposase, IS6 family